VGEENGSQESALGNDRFRSLQIDGCEEEALQGDQNNSEEKTLLTDANKPKSINRA